jgi:hypothetical protein
MLETTKKTLKSNGKHTKHNTIEEGYLKLLQLQNQSLFRFHIKCMSRYTGSVIIPSAEKRILSLEFLYLNLSPRKLITVNFVRTRMDILWCMQPYFKITSLKQVTKSKAVLLPSFKRAPRSLAVTDEIGLLVTGQCSEHKLNWISSNAFTTPVYNRTRIPTSDNL